MCFLSKCFPKLPFSNKFLILPARTKYLLSTNNESFLLRIHCVKQKCNINQLQDY